MLYSVFIILFAGSPAPPDSTGIDERPVLPWQMSEQVLPKRPNPSRDPHYLQVVATYEPGPGPGIYGQYVYAGLPSGFISATFGWRSLLFGSFSYTHNIELDFLGRHRLSVTPALFSDYQPNRLFDEVQVNERRSGGRIQSIYNYDYTDLYDFSQLLVLKHARVWMDPEEGATSLTDITSVETGPAIVRRATAGLLPADLLLEGRILGGWDHKNDALYSRVRLGGRWHYPLEAGFAFHTDIYGEWASPNVPLFERPSLGGSLSVRGYRLDALLGRTHLTGQQELWIPVPGTMSAEDGIGAMLRRNLRFAAFIDAAAIGRTTITNPEQSGIRTGAGLGLRIRAGGMTLRADWGHRLVDLGDGDFRGNFFLSIRPDLFLFF